MAAKNDKLDELSFNVLKKFHQDFISRADYSLEMQREDLNIQQERARSDREANARSLSNVVKPLSNAVTETTDSFRKSVEQSNKDLASKLDDKKVYGYATLSKKLSDLYDINKEFYTHQMNRDPVSELVKARVFHDILNSLDDIWSSGPSNTERIVHAVTNVERAIRGQESLVLDERTLMEMIADQVKAGKINLNELSTRLPETVRGMLNIAEKFIGGQDKLEAFLFKAATSSQNFYESLKVILSQGVKIATNEAQMSKGKLSEIIASIKNSTVINDLKNTNFKKAVDDIKSATGKINESVRQRAKQQQTVGGKRPPNKPEDFLEGFEVQGIWDGIKQGIFGDKKFSNSVAEGTVAFMLKSWKKALSDKKLLVGSSFLLGDTMTGIFASFIVAPIRTTKIAIVSAMAAWKIAMETPIDALAAVIFDKFGLKGVIMATPIIAVGKAITFFNNTMVTLNENLRKLVFVDMLGLLKGIKKRITNTIISLSFLYDIASNKAAETGKKIKMVLQNSMELFSVGTKLFSSIRESFAAGMNKTKGMIVPMLAKIGPMVMAGLAVVGEVIVASLPALIIGGLVLVGYLVYKNWDKVSKMWEDYVVTPVLDFFTETVPNMWNTGLSEISSLWGEYIIQPVSSLFDNFSGVFDRARDIFDTSILDPISNGFDWLKNGIGGIVTSFVDGVKSVVRKVLPESWANKLLGSEATTTPATPVSPTAVNTNVTEVPPASQNNVEIQQKAIQQNMSQEEMLARIDKTNELLAQIAAQGKLGKQPSIPVGRPADNIDNIPTVITTR